MNVALAKEAAEAHVLRSSPDTIHWGYFDGALEPVLTIDSGDRVTIECVSGNPEWMPPKSTGFEMLPELAGHSSAVKRGTGNHILTGPIFVRGAAVGDVLEVQHPRHRAAPELGLQPVPRLHGHAAGGLPLLPDHARRARPRAATCAILPSGLKVPMRPFFGQLAVAPPKAFGRQNSKEPREFGGNLDCKELTAGSTIYLPVWNEGALFSTGDGHAAQGDGEVERHRDRDRARRARSNSTCARIWAGGCRARKPRPTSSPSGSTPISTMPRGRRCAR